MGDDELVSAEEVLLVSTAEIRSSYPAEEHAERLAALAKYVESYRKHLALRAKDRRERNRGTIVTLN